MQPKKAEGRSYVPPCDLEQESALVIACLTYSGTIYKGYNFRGASISLGILPDAKDKTGCLNMPGTTTGSKTINGIIFQSSEDTDHAAGTYVDHYYYRAFNVRCYAADLKIAIVNYGNLDPGTVRKFTASDEDRVCRKLKQVLEKLVISRGRSNGK